MSSEINSLEQRTGEKAKRLRNFMQLSRSDNPLLQEIICLSGWTNLRKLSKSLRWYLKVCFEVRKMYPLSKTAPLTSLDWTVIWLHANLALPSDDYLLPCVSLLQTMSGTLPAFALLWMLDCHSSYVNMMNCLNQQIIGLKSLFNVDLF